jgi:hypothetical protein
MKIRALDPNDIDELRKIHEEHYKDEFPFPDFLNNFICAFVVVDDEGGIISGGGVRMIAESIMITDKDYPLRPRLSALCQVLDASEFVTRHAGLAEIHAFVQDDRWYNLLQKIGFLPTKGKPLVLELR